MPIDLLALISRDTQLKRTSVRLGGEYSGPCPLCRRGTDRFKVWPKLNRWACLGSSAGRAGCDLSGDDVAYLRQRDGLGFAEACDRLGVTPAIAHRRPPQMLSVSQPAPFGPPSPVWQLRAQLWVHACAKRLFAGDGERARHWLNDRGLTDATLRSHQLGFHPADRYEAPVLWGLPPADDGGCRRKVWLPRGITIPWFIDGALWRVNVRRPLSRSQAAAGGAKYVGPAGFANGLYLADTLTSERPAVLVEGELDALSLVQSAGDLVSAVATGSTAGSRRPGWVGRLALTPAVLVAFDADPAGDQAAEWWLRILPNARRWRPAGNDVNAMLVAGLDVRGWVEAGLKQG